MTSKVEIASALAELTQARDSIASDVQLQKSRLAEISRLKSVNAGIREQALNESASPAKLAATLGQNLTQLDLLESATATRREALLRSYHDLQRRMVSLPCALDNAISAAAGAVADDRHAEIAKLVQSWNPDGDPVVLSAMPLVETIAACPRLQTLEKLRVAAQDPAALNSFTAMAELVKSTLSVLEKFPEGKPFCGHDAFRQSANGHEHTDRESALVVGMRDSGCGTQVLARCKDIAEARSMKVAISEAVGIADLRAIGIAQFDYREGGLTFFHEKDLHKQGWNWCQDRQANDQIKEETEFLESAAAWLA